MGKSMAFMSPAAWLTVALAVIVCLAHSASPVDGVLEKLTQLIGPDDKAVLERTDEQWKGQRDGCLAALKKIRYKTWAEQAIEWLNRFGGISKEADCTDQVRGDLLYWHDRSKEFKKFNKLVQEYFQLYLHKCGFEDSFSKAIEKLKDVSHERWNSATLYMYLKSESLNPMMVSLVLAVIREISESDSISVEIKCNKQNVTNLLKWVYDSKAYGKLHNFIGDYFARYIAKCYEEHFIKAIGNLGKFAQREQSGSSMPFRLASYLAGYMGPQKALLYLSAIEEISEMDLMTKEDYCAEEHGTKLLEWFVTNRGVAYFRGLAGGYYAFFLDKCGFEDIFKSAIENGKKFSNQRWNSSLFSDLYSYIKRYCSSAKDVQELIAILKKISELSRISEQADCTDELESESVELLDKSSRYPELAALSGDYLSHYVDKCGNEDLLKRAIDNIKQNGYKTRLLENVETLESYFRVNSQLDTVDKLVLLRVIRQLSELENFSKDTHCTVGHLTELVKWINKVARDYRPNLLLKDYLGLYLDECGLEEKFKETPYGSANLFDRSEPRKDQTLVGYLWHYVPMLAWPERAMSAIEGRLD